MALSGLSQNSEWLMRNCPTEFKDKLQEFLVWGLRKGYIEIDDSSTGISANDIFHIERSGGVDVYQRLVSPLTATLYPEYRCNQHCYFCFAQNNMQKMKANLSKFEWEQAVDKCLAAQITHLVILGGEPFINKELLMAIVKRATPFIPVTIFTNGTVNQCQLVKYSVRFCYKGLT